MSNDDLYSEFAQYPEMTQEQKNVMMSVGLALFGVQGVEAKLKILLSYTFPERKDMTLQEMYDAHGQPSKETLGRLIKKLRERAAVEEDFETLLTSFLQKRNRFVHGLLADPEFNPINAAGIAKLHLFIDDMEAQCWHIDAILMGYIVFFVKALGVHKEIMPKDSIYFNNLEKYFVPAIQPKSW